MAIYRFWLNPFCEDRSKAACRVSIWMGVGNEYQFDSGI
jgi:hypothetical protein